MDVGWWILVGGLVGCFLSLLLLLLLLLLDRFQHVIRVSYDPVSREKLSDAPPVGWEVQR